MHIHTCKNRERTASKNSMADGWSSACRDACMNETFYEIASHNTEETVCGWTAVMKWKHVQKTTEC